MGKEITGNIESLRRDGDDIYVKMDSGDPEMQWDSTDWSNTRLLFDQLRCGDPTKIIIGSNGNAIKVEDLS